MLGSRIAAATEASPARTANAAELPAAQRAKATNRPLFRHSRNTAIGRRVRDLADAYALALGGWSELGDMLTANVLRAAELTALAEQARADALRNGNYDPLALSRLDGCANRAVRALGIKPGAVPKPPSLSEHLASLGPAPVMPSSLPAAPESPSR